MTSVITINSKLKTQNSKLESLDWQKMDGLVPAIIQQADSGVVLMLGYMNEQALALTQQTGRVHFWSRSRSELWLKGEKSGNYLLVDSLQADCDSDALLVRVREATGSTAVCHTGAATCFDVDTSPHPSPPPIWGREQGDSAPQQSNLSTLMGVVAQLMGPGGCPWDMAQTHTSLKPNLLEETYEALDALDALDIEDDIPHERKLAKLVDELGDLLGQVVYQAQIGTTNGEFTLDDIAAAFSAKLVRRHPHVFATTPISGLDEALKNWEHIKKAERTAEGGENTTGAGLRGIPATMPALHYAQQVQGRVKRSGYVWPERDALLVNLTESLANMAHTSERADALIEIGELLWRTALLARSLNVNAEEALRLTTRRFVNEYRD